MKYLTDTNTFYTHNKKKEKKIFIIAGKWENNEC